MWQMICTAKQRNDPFFSFEGIISSKIFHVKPNSTFFPDIKQSFKKANLLSLLEFGATYLDEKWTIDLYWSFVQGSQIIIYLSTDPQKIYISRMSYLKKIIIGTWVCELRFSTNSFRFQTLKNPFWVLLSSLCNAFKYSKKHPNLQFLCTMLISKVIVYKSYCVLSLLVYRRSAVSVVLISAILDSSRFIILSYFPPL